MVGGWLAVRQAVIFMSLRLSNKNLNKRPIGQALGLVFILGARYRNRKEVLKVLSRGVNLKAAELPEYLSSDPQKQDNEHDEQHEMQLIPGNSQQDPDDGNLL